MEDLEWIYDEVRRLVAVSPEKTTFDSKETVLLVFNKPLDGGPYEVEFKGRSHRFRMSAILLNNCTIQTHAPVYYPPEKTTISIYDKKNPRETLNAECSFEFISQSQALEDLLKKSKETIQLFCDSCGKLHEPKSRNEIQSNNVRGNLNYKVEDEDGYVKMNPAEPTFDERQDEDLYVDMARYKNDLRVAPDLWKAITIAEQAVNESWRNNQLGEETAELFSQFIRRSAKERSVNSSPIYDATRSRVSAPTVPPKSSSVIRKRHSMHGFPKSVPPLPPRSPRSPTSPWSSTGIGGHVAGERQGSDPNIIQRLEQDYDKLIISKETAHLQPEEPQPPQIPARSKGPVPARGVNGLQQNPDLPKNFLLQKSYSLDRSQSIMSSSSSSSVGSPRDIRRKPPPLPGKLQRRATEPALHARCDRKLSETDEDGYVTVLEI